jgi:prolyl oligopeptidase
MPKDSRAFFLLVALAAGVASLPFADAAPLVAQSTGASSEAETAASGRRPLTLAPFKRGDRVFSTDASGALYVRDKLDGAPRLLLPAGSYNVVAPSNNGTYVAYALVAPGANSYEVRVRVVQTGRDSPNVLHHATISRTPWTHNEAGFFYTREDPADQHQRVYFHGVDRSETDDVIMLSVPDHPEWRYNARVSDDGNYAVFTISHPIDAHTRMYFIDLGDAEKPTLDAPKVRLIDSFSARYEFIDNAGTYFFLQTNRDAPRGQVVLANTGLTRASRWPTTIPESADSLLYVRTAGNEFVIAVYHSGERNVARMFGPPDPNAVRKELQQRIDSLRAAHGDERNNGRTRIDRDELLALRSRAAIRLDPKGDFPIPALSSILAMNTVADADQVFYTVKMPDGTVHSFVYDVRKGSTQPFPASAVSH